MTDESPILKIGAEYGEQLEMINWAGKSLFALGILIAAITGPVTAIAWSAQDIVSIELNRMIPVKGACRMSFVFTNKMEIALDEFSIETVLFNKEGSVERFLVLNSRPLSPKKIRVQQFDIRGIKCDVLGRVLLNDVKACKAGDLTPAACLERIELSSRADIPFVSTAISN